MALFDCFMFFDELERLEIRLHELDPIVDKFIVNESLEVFGSREKKEPILHKNWKILKKYEHKVIYEVLPKLEPEFNDVDSGWKREFYQRNALMPLINSVSPAPDDIILISDCDEIPDAKVVMAHLDDFRREPHALEQYLFYYRYTNCMGKINATTACTYAYMKEREHAGAPQTLRNKMPLLPRINDAGWHFSYFGDAERLRRKVRCYAHANDPDRLQFLAQSNHDITKDIESGEDLFHHARGVLENREWSIEDPRLPEWVRMHEVEL